MKNMRKLATLLLALVMLFTLAVSASADETAAHTITINNSASGYTYEAYQIFKGDYTGAKLTNVDWGAGIDTSKVYTELNKVEAFADCDSVEDVLAVLTAAKDESDVAKAFADAVSKALSTQKAGTADTYSDGKYVINVTGDGYYLVLNTAVPSASGTNNAGAYTRFILEVVDNATATHKGSVPTVDKNILDPSEVKVNEAAIGEKVNYKISGTLPTNIADYEAYYYMFTDTLSKGLTYNNDVKVTIGETDVTKYFYVSNATDETTKVTTIKVGIADLLALKKLETNPVSIDDNTAVVVTYSATVNDDAVIGGDSNNSGNPNDVTLTFSNDPNFKGNGSTTPPPENPKDEPEAPDRKGETPKSTVTTYVTELTILKHDGNNKVLTGAKFRITGNSIAVDVKTFETFVENENGTYYKLKDGTFTTVAPVEDGSTNDLYENTEKKYSKKVMSEVATTDGNSVYQEGEVDDEGKVTFKGLAAGTYTITEIVTPAGYNTIEPITFTITFDATTKKFASDNTSITVGENNKLDTTIINRAGSTLPSTGGVGTTLFYVIGSVLVLAAVVLLVTKKRMSSVQ